MARKNKSPQKAAMREMMRRYLKDNDMRDPDQPKRDSFDLGDFLRSTLTGGLMGGLFGVAFYGMDKAVKALEGSLTGDEIDMVD